MGVIFIVVRSWMAARVDLSVEAGTVLDDPTRPVSRGDFCTMSVRRRVNGAGWVMCRETDLPAVVIRQPGPS